MKKVVKKKLICGLLAAIMCAGLGVPAFADDPTPTPDPDGNTVNDSDSSVNIAATVSGQSDIKVSIVPSGGVILNPYGLEVLIPDSFGNRTPTTSTVISAPYALKNKSNTDLDVSVNIKTTKGDTIVLEGDPGDKNSIAKDTGDDKRAFLFLQFIDRMKQDARDTVATDLPYSNENEPAVGTTNNWAGKKWLDPAVLCAEGVSDEDIAANSNSDNAGATRFYNNTDAYNEDEMEGEGQSQTATHRYSNTCTLADSDGTDGRNYAQVAKLEHSGASQTGVSAVWYKILGLTSNPASADHQWGASTDTLSTKLTFRFSKSLAEKKTTSDPYKVVSVASPYYSKGDDLLLPFTMPADLLLGHSTKDIEFQRIVIEGIGEIPLSYASATGWSGTVPGGSSAINNIVELTLYGTQIKIKKEAFEVYQGTSTTATGRTGGDELRFTVAYNYTSNTTQKTVKTGASYYVTQPAWAETATALNDFIVVDDAGNIETSTFGVRLVDRTSTANPKAKLPAAATSYVTNFAPTVADSTTYRTTASANNEVTFGTGANGANMLTLSESSAAAVAEVVDSDGNVTTPAASAGHKYLSSTLKVPGDEVTYYVPVSYKTTTDAFNEYCVYKVNVTALAKADQVGTIASYDGTAVVVPTGWTVPSTIGAIQSVAVKANKFTLYGDVGTLPINTETEYTDLLSIAADGKVTINNTANGTGAKLLTEMAKTDFGYAIIRGTITWTGTDSNGGTDPTLEQTFQIKITP